MIITVKRKFFSNLADHLTHDGMVGNETFLKKLGFSDNLIKLIKKEAQRRKQSTKNWSYEKEVESNKKIFEAMKKENLGHLAGSLMNLGSVDFVKDGDKTSVMLSPEFWEDEPGSGLKVRRWFPGLNDGATISRSPGHGDITRVRPENLRHPDGSRLKEGDIYIGKDGKAYNVVSVLNDPNFSDEYKKKHANRPLKLVYNPQPEGPGQLPFEEQYERFKKMFLHQPQNPVNMEKFEEEAENAYQQTVADTKMHNTTSIEQAGVNKGNQGQGSHSTSGTSNHHNSGSPTGKNSKFWKRLGWGSLAAAGVAGTVYGVNRYIKNRREQEEAKEKENTKNSTKKEILGN